MNSPRITLSNGLTIANFSSPHPFTFTTGEILPACKPKWVKKMSLDIDEKEIPMPKEFQDFVWYDIKLTITIPQHVSEQIVLLNKDTDIDIILVPFMVLKALNKHHNKFAYSYFKKCRVIRVADRVTKEIYPDRFCI